MIEFIGKFHPVLVHLPIGLLVLLAVFELAPLLSRQPDLAAATRLTLLVTVPAALASVLCGWLQASGREYDGVTLAWHRWLGTALGVTTLLLLAVHWRGSIRLYRIALAVTLALLVVASHLGGSLTHGSDFLSWPGSSPAGKASPPVDLKTQPVYAAVIQPLFDKYCVGCHGADKAKGGLRMDTAANLLKGGNSGAVLTPPSARLSLLGKLISLPLDSDDHMPPAVKPQLSNAQLTVLRWWLDAGAATDKTVSELNPPPDIFALLQTLTTHAPQ
jgi:uncharacterized membrane protein/mono/diheme cytochrome c family protein